MFYQFSWSFNGSAVRHPQLAKAVQAAMSALVVMLFYITVAKEICCFSGEVVQHGRHSVSGNEVVLSCSKLPSSMSLARAYPQHHWPVDSPIRSAMPHHRVGF